LVKLEFAGFDVEGDKFAVIIGLEFRPHLAVVQVDAHSGDFFGIAAGFGERHLRPYVWEELGVLQAA